MNGYVGITDMWGLLRNDQLKYFDIVFRKVQRKLSLREFAIVMRAMERGINARRIGEMLFAGAPTVH